MDTNNFAGFVTPTREALDAVLAAVQMAGREEAPIAIPQGMAGGCVACQHTMLSHFAVRDGRVTFVGCLKGEADTVYILVPAKGARANGGPATDGVAVVDGAPVATSQARGFKRARYFSGLHHKANPENAMGGELSDTRLKVLKAVHAAGKVGLRAKDIMKRTKLPHGSVQQTLNWLRGQKLVEAREDKPVA